MTTRWQRARTAGRLLGALAAAALGCSPSGNWLDASRPPAPRAPPAAAEADPPSTLPPAEPSQPAASAVPASSGAPQGAEPSGPAFPDVPFTLRGERDRVIEVYPPVSTQGRWPLVVLLHATCMQPGPVCDAFGHAGRDVGWLVCPAGNSACYGEPDWSGPGPTKAAFLAQALSQAEASIGPFVDERPGVLVGWSRGAYAARDILDAAATSKPPGPMARRFVGLVLLAASVPLDPARLRAAGIERVVFAAGDHDGARPAMTSNASSLRAAGMEARYVSLGKIGHWWPDDFEARMSEPIAWAARGQGAQDDATR